LIESYLWIFIASLMPGFEGRYAIVVAISLSLDPLISFAVVMIASIVLAVTLAYLVSIVDELLNRIAGRGGLIGKLASSYLQRVNSMRSKVSVHVKKYGVIGLALFVAIPLPVTGIWTGALIAYLLGLRRRHSIVALIIGGLLANIITFTLTFLVKNVIGP